MVVRRKKIEAPRSINSGDARRWYLSHQSLATSHLRLLIPSHSYLLSNLWWQLRRKYILQRSCHHNPEPFLLLSLYNVWYNSIASYVYRISW